MPFISLEGVDGCGKSTQARLLAGWLREQGRKVVLTKEPDGGRLGAPVRAILVNGQLAPSLAPAEELLLIAAARYDHVRSVIAPAVAAGNWVVCDRFIDSTFAYQMFETGLQEALLETVNRAVVGTTMPDLSFILDVPLEVARSRRERADDARALDPAEERRDFDRIRRGFRHAAARDPARCRLIDGSGDSEEVLRRIRSKLMPI